LVAHQRRGERPAAPIDGPVVCAISQIWSVVVPQYSRNTEDRYCLRSKPKTGSTYKNITKKIELTSMT